MTELLLSIATFRNMTLIIRKFIGYELVTVKRKKNSSIILLHAHINNYNLQSMNQYFELAPLFFNTFAIRFGIESTRFWQSVLGISWNQIFTILDIN